MNMQELGAMKKTRIIYDPYKNSIDISYAPSLDSDWQRLPESSPLRNYTTEPALFSNCVVDIVERIDKGQNSSPDGLVIDFCGTDADYRILEKTVENANADRFGAGRLVCHRSGRFESADKALATIRACYGRIASEFYDYVPGGKRYIENKELGDAIVKFEETISDEVPICIVGNYSVGKSALLNAIIGDEIMPSSVDPSTARNVKVAHCPDAYSVTIEHILTEGKEDISFHVSDGVVYPTDDVAWAYDFLKYLNDSIGFENKSSKLIIHGILDLLNNGEDGMLAEVGMNVLVKLPFADSVVTNLGRGVAFYDTPGSNNSNIDQSAHKAALREFMSEQTNALPIVATTRDAIMSDDNMRLRKMLDEFRDNFSSLNSLVVIAKCDTLSDTELRGGISSKIKSWHGRTPVLYTTAIGALGERKGIASEWIDPGLKKQYRDWLRRYEEDSDVRTLPRYNEEPCSGRETFDIKAAYSDALYATGIPSLECEIMRYAHEYADYKKCERGRSDLLSVLEIIKREIRLQRESVVKAQKESKEKREQKKQEIIEELNSIRIQSLYDLIASTYHDFLPHLDAYIAELRGVVGEAYDAAVSNGEEDLSEYVNERLRSHCQEKLIDACYLGEQGIRARIIDEYYARAESFANLLHAFIEGNDSHFTEEGKAMLATSIERGSVKPRIKNVESVLPPFASLFQVIVATQYGIFKLAGEEQRARSVWIDGRCKQLGEALKDGKRLLGDARVGLFSETAIYRPIGSYEAQLRDWANNYRELIMNCLDDENSLLSGMEKEISEHEEKLQDLVDRLGRLADAEKELENVLAISYEDELREDFS